MCNVCSVHCDGNREIYIFRESYYSHPSGIPIARCRSRTAAISQFYTKLHVDRALHLECVRWNYFISFIYCKTSRRKSLSFMSPDSAWSPFRFTSNSMCQLKRKFRTYSFARCDLYCITFAFFAPCMKRILHVATLSQSHIPLIYLRSALRVLLIQKSHSTELLFHGEAPHFGRYIFHVPEENCNLQTKLNIPVLGEGIDERTSHAPTLRVNLSFRRM